MKRAILLGDSPFIGEVEDSIRYVLDRYYTIGINRIITKFSVNAHVFVDPFILPLTNQYPELFTLSLARYKDFIPKTNKVLYETFAFNLKKDTPKELKKDGKLAWCGFTHDFALSYLIMEGYDDIVLLGAADCTAGAHYSNPYDLVCSEKIKANSKKFIEEVCCKRATIRTCNPNSFLSIPRISMQELLV